MELNQRSYCGQQETDETPIYSVEVVRNRLLVSCCKACAKAHKLEGYEGWPLELSSEVDEKIKRVLSDNGF